MIHPAIHLNGTAKQDLLEQWSDASEALVNAIVKLNAAGPNGRDYYPQGSDAFEQALNEHIERVTKLRDVRKELQELMEHVYEQGDNR